MIKTSNEFIKLRDSENEAEYRRAAHEEAPLNVWLEIIEKYPNYRIWVAHNKTVPLLVLEILAGDLDRDVRSMVASKNKLPEALQYKLAGDSDESVRQRVVFNKNTMEAVLERLQNDEWEPIREQAQKRIAGKKFKGAL